MSALDAEILMRRVADRDAVAFDSLYESYHRMVFGIALHLLGDAASAEDLRQSVFFKVWAKPHAFKGGSFAAWIARVARNGGVDVLRRRSTHCETHAGAESLDSSFEDAVIAGIEAEQLRGALARLPQRERLLIEMGFFGGMTHQAVAADTGVALGTVKTRIRSGLHRLRAALADGSAARRERGRCPRLPHSYGNVPI